MKVAYFTFAAATISLLKNDIGFWEARAFGPVALACKRPFAAGGQRLALRFTTTGMIPSVANKTLEPASSLHNKKNNLLQIAHQLKSEHGLFLIDSIAKQQLTAAVSALESESTPPSEWTEEMRGDWELVCTTATTADIDTSQIPFLDSGPLQQIRDAVLRAANAHLTVTQRIGNVGTVISDSDESTNDTMLGLPASGIDHDLNRVDHVLEYRPPTALSEVLDHLPEPLLDVNINPLQVSKSRLILVHYASVVPPTNFSNVEAILTIQLGLASIVLNEAGINTFMDPSGKDVSSLNLPLDEFWNTGSFSTTYVDHDLRISRGPHGWTDDPLRVFVRSKRQFSDPGVAEVAADGMDKLLGFYANEALDQKVGSIEKRPK